MACPYPWGTPWLHILGGDPPLGGVVLGPTGPCCCTTSLALVWELGWQISPVSGSSSLFLAGLLVFVGAGAYCVFDAAPLLSQSHRRPSAGKEGVGLPNCPLVGSGWPFARLSLHPICCPSHGTCDLAHYCCHW